MNTKIKSFAAILIVSMLSVYINIPVSAQSALPSEGDVINGFTVTDTREVTAVRDGITVVMTIDSNVMEVTDGDNNVSTVVLDCPVVIREDYTMIPLRAISESLGFDVDWDGNTRTVYLH